MDSFVISRDAYKRLHDWVDQRQLRDTSVSIGPKGSYFARCGEAWISHALPKDLQNALDRNKDKFTPIQVALGSHGSWIVVWSDGDVTWNLRSSYPGIGENKVLTGSVGQVTFVALNPYQDDEYFIAGETGWSFNMNFPTHAAGNEIQKMVDNYMQMRAKRDNATINYSGTLNGVKQNVHITANSLERQRADSLLDTWRMRRGLLLRKDNMAMIGAGSAATYVLARSANVTPLKAVGIAAASGLGMTAMMYWGISDGLRSSI